MKSLKESLLGNIESNIKSGDLISEDPFKYLVSRPKKEIEFKAQCKQTLEDFEIQIASKCKSKPWDKARGKYILGIDYTFAMLPYRIYIKCGKDLFVLNTNKSNDITYWDLYLRGDIRNQRACWERCEKVYILTNDLVEKFEELRDTFRHCSKLIFIEHNKKEAEKIWQEYINNY